MNCRSSWNDMEDARKFYTGCDQKNLTIREMHIIQNTYEYLVNYAAILTTYNTFSYKKHPVNFVI